jgi:hypothetical protein
MMQSSSRMLPFHTGLPGAAVIGLAENPRNGSGSNSRLAASFNVGSSVANPILSSHDALPNRVLHLSPPARNVLFCQGH